MKRAIFPALILSLCSDVFAQEILVEGAQSQGHPEIPYSDIKPPSPSLSLGTTFSDPAPSASFSKTFRIKNTAAPLSSGLTLSAASNNPQFTISGLANLIKAGNQDLFTITYSPTGTSSATASIEITSNDPSRLSYRFQVRGAGGSESVTFLNSNNEEITFAETPGVDSRTDFGQSPRGGTGVTRNFVLKNTGSLPVVYSSFRILHNRFVSDANEGVLGLAPGQEFPFFIQAKTDQVGTFDATISAQDDGNAPFASFRITSEVTGQPGLSEPCRFQTGTGHCFDIVGAYDFGEVDLGSTSTILIRVTNDGEEPLEFDPSALSSSNPAFAANGLAGTLVVGESDTFAINFSPASTGSTLGEISIHSNASGEETLTIPVEGIGVSPASPDLRVLFESAPGSGQFFVGPSSLPISEIEIDDSSGRSFQITNSGDADLVFNSISVEGPHFRLDGGLPASLSPGGQRVLTLVFEPQNVGSHPTKIIFDTNISPEPIEIELPRLKSKALPDIGYPLTAIREVGENLEFTISPFPSAESGSEFRIATTANLASLIWFPLNFVDLNLSNSTDSIVVIPKSSLNFDTLPQAFFRLQRNALPPTGN